MGKTKRDIKKAKAKAKLFKPKMRLVLPPNKRHKSKKDYKRKNKVDPNEFT
jgi:hypothetical protein